MGDEKTAPDGTTYDPRTHRIRRGKVVEIPEKWRGKVTNRQTIGKRASKQPHKRRRAYKNSGHGYTDSEGMLTRQERRAPTQDEWDVSFDNDTSESVW